MHWNFVNVYAVFIQVSLMRFWNTNAIFNFICLISRTKVNLESFIDKFCLIFHVLNNHWRVDLNVLTSLHISIVEFFIVFWYIQLELTSWGNSPINHQFTKIFWHFCKRVVSFSFKTFNFCSVFKFELNFIVLFSQSFFREVIHIQESFSYIFFVSFNTLILVKIPSQHINVC